MPRGVRKSELEKLQDELTEVQNAIGQYQDALKTMKEKENNLKNLISQEEFKAVQAMMAEKGISLNDLKAILEEIPAEEMRTA
ncbi:hypothetical protein GPL15_08585 [Clostridium sp. MCC353]|uniref:hypothetical protein n=1 Tax=Clostridium sp. MCC353 TaxID=2592646 RepID=UPI001C0337A9|nr:hypothetical protein [Clostridium sp. MCC353]MBS6646945.1 hypothetical protein [Clostridiaceae bacterium]MBT9776559.1 hypothetical protein [Clostridium sp. MCC353]